MDELEEYQEKRRSFLALPKEKQDEITTEEEAAVYILRDTMSFAAWGGCIDAAKRDGATVADALRRYCKQYT